MAEQGIQDIVRSRGTHFDSMIERLKEERVRRVISPLIIGDEVEDKGSDDYLYTRDLGLIRERDGEIEPANPIYAELIIRTLSWNAQDMITRELKDRVLPRYLKDGGIDMDFLIEDFQAYWRENSEIWTKRYKTTYYQYDEAAPHLVMHAFFQRVLNGGGDIIREMALGTKRADLCVVYGDQKYPIELKILQNEKKREDSLNQTLAYMDKVGADAGWLVIFDRDASKAWDEKVYMKKEARNGKTITVAGC